MMKFFSLLFIAVLMLSEFVTAQTTYPTYDSVIVDYGKPLEYTIAGIAVSGTLYLDKDILIAIAGIKTGDRIEIPGQEITKAIQNLWKQDLFANVRIYVDHTEGDKAFLAYVLDERPRLSGFTFRGTKKGEEDDIRQRIGLNRSKVLTDNVKVNTINTIKNFYTEKGYLNTKVTVTEMKDTTQPNSMLYYIYVDRGRRVKIDEITFNGNSAVSKGKLHRLMKKTKENTWYPWSVFTISRFKKKEYDADKTKILSYYAAHGYRDARIVSDSVYKNDRGYLNIDISLTEGNKYYFRNIDWTGNTKYSDAKLDSALRIKKGDVYDEAFLEKRLNGDQRGDDVGSLYMDDGYLFFQVTPVEVNVENDSIDLEIRLHEGAQAIINRVNIVGNSKTHEHVVRRVIRTLPGSKFSRADVIRSQREIATLGFFDPEKLDIRTDPHPETGSV
ncbi:MAG TPA: POTRA domain-containing protein, partial [Chitinophagales bacterium]|nr:POTRA domain-containing protein [Chitinophagales bacterium]